MKDETIIEHNMMLHYNHRPNKDMRKKELPKTVQRGKVMLTEDLARCYPKFPYNKHMYFLWFMITSPSLPPWNMLSSSLQFTKGGAANGPF